MNFIYEQTVKVGKTDVVNYLPKRGIESVQNELISGLKAEQKYISPKYFYDKYGSELFEQITQLHEYYPTRCEKEILSSIVAKSGINFYNLDIIELGSGDASKIKSIFKQIPATILATINYYPVDISQTAIENAVRDINNTFNLNHITGIVADFLHKHNYIERNGQRLFCFLGGTIGNLSPNEVKHFMNELGKVMHKGDGLLLGVDLVKNIQRIELAYNDKKGVTAEFNRNILNVVNSHIQSSFNPADFEHLAFYNQEHQRIEMHLIAKRDLQVRIGCINELISIKKGERIHTENSYKFSPNKLEKIGQYGGLNIHNIFSDSKEWFSLVYYTK